MIEELKATLCHLEVTLLWMKGTFMGFKTKAGLCFRHSCLQFQCNGNQNIRSAPRPPLETASHKDQVHLISFTPTMRFISIAPPMFQMVSYTLPRSYSFFQAVPLRSTRKEPPNHSSRDIPRNTPSVQRTPRQIRRMPKFITPRKRKRVRNRQTQRDDDKS